MHFITLVLNKLKIMLNVDNLARTNLGVLVMSREGIIKYQHTSRSSNIKALEHYTT